LSRCFLIANRNIYISVSRVKHCAIYYIVPAKVKITPL
jgi:hypothetical protein